MTPTAAPPERFNFARHLLTLNAGRAEKTALIDDQGTLSYGELADQVQRFAGALTALGLRREERVLLLMHDSSDWVVAFLGALHAARRTTPTCWPTAARRRPSCPPRCCPHCRPRWPHRPRR